MHALVHEREDDNAVVAEEALFPEARRLRRRRWAIRAAVVLIVIAAAALAVALTAGRGHARPTSRGESAGAIPAGGVTSLGVAGALAVGSTDALYVADPAQHRVLVRLPDGRFRVIAGTGAAGYSGDGGAALHARLSNVSELAFSPTGRLYLVDGGRIRVITTAGVIDTVAGNGRPDDRIGHPPHRIAAGTPARSAPLGTAAENAGPSIAFSPDGALYISTPAQILRLTARGTLQPVNARAFRGPSRVPFNGLSDVAIDGHGNIDVSGVNGWSVWQLAPDGRAHEVGSGSGARQSGGNTSVLQRAPDGTVDAEDGPTILRVTTHRLVPTFAVRRVRREYFWPTYFAFGPHGTTYLDEIPGDSGFEAHQQLISMHANQITLLWQQHTAGSHDSFGPH